MGKSLIRIAAIFTALIAGTAAYADEAFDIYAIDVALLMDKGIQKAINLQEIQRFKLNKHADWFNAESAKLAKATTSSNAAAQQKKMDTLLGDFKKKVVAELSKWQKGRMREISLQAAGPLALLDERISGKVGLSKPQLKKLRDVYEANTKKSAEISKKAFDPIVKKYAAKKPKTEAEKKKLQADMDKEMAAASKKIQPELDKLSKSFQALIGSTLNDQQEKNYKALLGTPYKPQ